MLNISWKGTSDELNVSKVGNWDDMVETSRDVQSLLESDEVDEVHEEVEERQLKNLAQEWKDWRPSDGERFSREMREKTAKQATGQFSETKAPMGRSLTKKLVEKLHLLEEKVYKLMLKTNALYFDHGELNVTLSKQGKADSSERYQMTFHSNNPHLRELLAERINGR